MGADKVGFDFAIIVLCWFFHQPDEEDVAKLEFHEWLFLKNFELGVKTGCSHSVREVSKKKNIHF